MPGACSAEPHSTAVGDNRGRGQASRYTCAVQDKRVNPWLSRGMGGLDGGKGPPVVCLEVDMAGTPMKSALLPSSCPMSAAAMAPSTAPSPRIVPGMITAVTPNTTCSSHNGTSDEEEDLHIIPAIKG